ncbi:hypothetical protein [Burkholderia plantarii]|uniref:Uncharacterized protein n=1 Tax=Burkholderia plantarii TaxID=41899 RepID=A0A0B6S250_BURPL|nr:hypothetical protein [Burkholderia plantarii]AJK47370.1 hypothetical protein BGL_1c28930 [Burkholderia plantarii]
MPFHELPPVSTEQAVVLWNSIDATQLGFRLRHELSRAVEELDPFTLIALARRHHPNMSDLDALQLLGDEAIAMLKALREHGTAAREVLTAEKDRLHPKTHAATRRAFEIEDEVRLLTQSITSHSARTRERRAQLEAASVPNEDIEWLAPMTPPTDLIAKRDALVAEQSARHQFISSLDERHLPEGFVVPPVFRITTNMM